MAAGMSYMAGKIETGMGHRDAVAAVLKESKSVIFTGNGYSAEWPLEATKRGLPNLKDTPMAISQWASNKNKKLLAELGIFSEEETEARKEVMYEAYITAISVEVQTLIEMMNCGIIPACVKDLAKYRGVEKMSSTRDTLYQSVVAETETLRNMYQNVPHEGLDEEASYYCYKLKPQMVKVRMLVDEAESLLENGLYPYPTYEELVFHHHF